jgi:hypothetical protein
LRLFPKDAAPGGRCWLRKGFQPTPCCNNPNGEEKKRSGQKGLVRQQVLRKSRQLGLRSGEAGDDGGFVELLAAGP